MIVNLRKAAALQAALQEVFRKSPLPTTISINEFQDADAASVTGRAELLRTVGSRVMTNAAVYDIRKAVSQANAVAISSVLADIAKTQYEIDLYSTLVDTARAESMAVIKGKLDKIRSRPADGRGSLYGYSDNVDTSVINEVDHDSFEVQLKNCKRDKQRLQDQLLELNITTTIELSETTVAVLATHGLV